MTSTATAKTSARLTIDVWADVLCPWCYIGEHRLSQAIKNSPHADEIELKIHTFQLDPNAPTTAIPTLEYLSKKYGVTQAQARAQEEAMSRQATSEGLEYKADRPARNTLDMLRLIHLAGEYDAGWDYLRAMQTEVFSGHEDAFEHATLIRLGEQLAVPAEEIRDVLATDRYTDAVHADHNKAVNMGANGVPFTVLGQRLGVPGAVSAEQYGAAIRKAWEQANG
ncbi:DsbA family oxidoreductase [Streptomyces acidicola]|uniref:DsbA family oxidoreductase n=1 Tax=Streptomyces acidicola TaxID=2596892 RepID=UPI003805B642